MWGWAATPHENTEPILLAQKTLYQPAQNFAARSMPERRPKDAKRMNRVSPLEPIATRTPQRGHDTTTDYIALKKLAVSL
jgi:hypothetical protein